jgi:hypothetical protein
MDSFITDLENEIRQQQNDLSSNRVRYNWLRMTDGTHHFRIIPDKNNKLAFTSASHFNVKINVKNRDIPVNCPPSTFFRGIREKNEKECPVCKLYFSYLDQAKSARSKEEKDSWKKMAKTYNNSTKHNVLAVPWDPMEDGPAGEIGILSLSYTLWADIVRITTNYEDFEGECVSIVDKMVDSGEIESRRELKNISRPDSLFSPKHGKIFSIRRWKESGFTKYKFSLSVSNTPITKKMIEDAPALEEVFSKMYVDRTYVHDYDALSYALLTTMKTRGDEFVDGELKSEVTEAAKRYVVKREEREKGNTGDEIEDIEKSIEDIGGAASEDPKKDDEDPKDGVVLEADGISETKDDDKNSGPDLGDNDEDGPMPWEDD